jgi:hypothetical protein
MEETDRVYRLIYVSSAIEYFDEAALMDLLAQARANNARLGITGLLLYGEGAFLQLLEGPRDAVEALYATIREDSRHTLCMVLDEDAHVPRLFGDWRMAFHRRPWTQGSAIFWRPTRRWLSCLPPGPSPRAGCCLHFGTDPTLFQIPIELLG